MKNNQYVTQVHVAGRILQAFAADIWPGRQENRLRFVQLLVDYTAPALGVRTISVPMLASYLGESGWLHEANNLNSRWSGLSEEMRSLGIDVDAGESELTSICPSVPRSILRKFSYANLLFDEIFRDGQDFLNGDLERMSMPRAEVGYAYHPEKKVRVCFGVDWLLALVVSAEELTRAVDPFQRFDQWWLSN
ncbi:hypothetical protein [Dyella sp.]|uniref:hypothetical protein n=1 Tax=Dyella sp. TaxID=1869338 RepID=UPI0028525055|nr:hypothetical protein [Dyella sp.]